MKLVHGFYIMYTLPGPLCSIAQNNGDREENGDWTSEEITLQVKHSDSQAATLQLTQHDNVTVV